MTAYVESNFVLEIALQQEEFEAGEAILALAREKKLKLVVPAFSLAEPHIAISGKEKARNQLSRDLNAHLNDLARSRQHQSLPTDFADLAAILVKNAQIERAGVQDAVVGLLDCAEVIPLDAVILRAALGIQVEFEISGPDSIVLASVLEHLKRTQPERSCFLNRNTKDFDDPDIRGRLAEHKCRFFGKFGQALGYLRAPAQ